MVTPSILISSPESSGVASRSRTYLSPGYMQIPLESRSGWPLIGPSKRSIHDAYSPLRGIAVPIKNPPLLNFGDVTEKELQEMNEKPERERRERHQRNGEDAADRGKWSIWDVFKPKGDGKVEQKPGQG